MYALIIFFIQWLWFDYQAFLKGSENDIFEFTNHTRERDIRGEQARTGRETGIEEGKREIEMREIG